jgi:nucleoside 2-deoxyribosyltransferase
MEKLKGAVGYLSGGMEYAKNCGVLWRRRFVEMCHRAHLQIDFIDPTNKPGGQDMKIGECQEIQNTLQRNGEFEKLKEYVSKYRHHDLRFVDLSDFLVALIDPTIPQWGTSNEIYVAEEQHKPTFLICEGGLYNLPRWLFDVVPLDCVFDSLESVIERLVALNEGQEELCDDWVLVRKFIEESRETRHQAEEWFQAAQIP